MKEFSLRKKLKKKYFTGRFAALVKYMKFFFLSPKWIYFLLLLLF